MTTIEEIIPNLGAPSLVIVCDDVGASADFIISHYTRKQSVFLLEWMTVLDGQFNQCLEDGDYIAAFQFLKNSVNELKHNVTLVISDVCWLIDIGLDVVDVINWVEEMAQEISVIIRVHADRWNEQNSSIVYAMKYLLHRNSVILRTNSIQSGATKDVDGILSILRGPLCTTPSFSNIAAHYLLTADGVSLTNTIKQK